MEPKDHGYPIIANCLLFMDCSQWHGRQETDHLTTLACDAMLVDFNG